MSFLLDTNICSAFLKRPGPLTHRFLQYAGNLSIPSIVLAELYTWAYRRSDPQPLLSLIERDLLPECKLLGFDSPCARRFGRLRATLLGAGVVVNPVDLMIGAVALEHDLTLVTNNHRHFEPIPNLRLVDWLP